MLDQKDREGSDQGGQQAYAAVIQSPADGVDEDQAAKIEDGGSRSADQVDLVVAELAQPLRQVAHQEDRQGSVDEEAETYVVGIEAGLRGVEVLRHRRREGGGRSRPS